MKTRKNIPLIVGLAIPVLMVLFVAGSIYLPGFFVRPRFSFLYSTGDSYYSRYQYSLENGKLVENEVEYPKHEVVRSKPNLFVYDIVEDKGMAVSFEEAQQLTLNPNSKSPDGFEVDCGRKSTGYFLLFFDSFRDCSSRFIKGRGTSKKLNVQLRGGSDYSFQFLGWLVEE